MKKAILFFVFVMMLFVVKFVAATPPPVGALIKGSASTVYYYASNGNRYAFSDANTYFTWFSGFSAVQTISNYELSNIPLKGVVTYRPGIRLIKIQSDPRVYAVDRGGVLRWLKTEEVAKQLYGERWDTLVADVSDSMFVNYKSGEPISTAADFNPELVAAEVVTIDNNLGLADVPYSPRSDTKIRLIGSVAPLTNVPGADDLLPELLPFAPSDFHFDTINGRTMLRFTGAFWNAGDAPLELISKSTDAVSTGDDYLDTYQRIKLSSGAFRDALVGKFLWHAAHDHYHYANFGDYVLQAVSIAGDISEKPKTITQKTTFCMRDDQAIKMDADGKPLPSTIQGHCGKNRQVLSVGWADVYKYTLPDQYFDVQDLPAGIYRTSFVVDPLKSFTEKSNNNNMGSAFIQLDSKAKTVKVLAAASPFPTPKNVFQNGMLLRTEGATQVYTIHNNKKRLLASAEIAASYGGQIVYEVPKGVIEALPSNALIRLAGTSAIYVVNDGGYRRRIVDPGVMTSYGFTNADVVDVGQSEFASYPESDLIMRAGDTRVYSINSKRMIGTIDALAALGRSSASVHVANDTDFEANATEVVAKNLMVPWDIAFLPDGDMLVTERSGQLNRLGSHPTSIDIPSVKHTGEGGLMGIALHPDFSVNHLLYLYMTTVEDIQKNRVVRFRFEDNKLTQDKIIIDDIPSAIYHDGGQLAFGPDGMLYLTTGDASASELSQNTSSLAGKTLRLTPDGGIPADNPLGTAVWSYGHRNAQGIAWDAQGRMWQTEHGRSGALSGLDELNLIQPGKNYGWPSIQGSEVRAGMVKPILHSGPDVTWAPSGMAFVGGRLFFAGLRGVSLYEATPGDDMSVSNFKAHLVEKYGRLRAVVVGPNGDLYITTSNRDSRGTPMPGDDKIIRVNPEFLR